MATLPRYQLFDLALPAATLADAVTRAGSADSLITTNPWAVKKVFSAMIGGNGFAAAGTGALLTQIADLAAYYDARRAAGFKVIAVTWLPRTTPTFNDARNQVNAAIRTWVGTHCDALADMGADPVMGPDAAASDTTLYSDGIHPTAHGQALLEAIFRPVINGL